MPGSAKISDSPPPRVAVIVPAYGVAHLVGEALASLQAQTIADWECVVIDDGAPDDVAAAVAPFLADSRIRFLHTANHGVSAARNTAIAATTAPLVALLDGDDLLRPEYLERMCAAMADGATELATCNARIFGVVPRETLIVLPHHRPPPLADVADVIGGRCNIYIGSVFRRSDWERVSGFDAEMTHSEDLDFWVRLLMAGGKVRYVDEVLGDYRVRGNSASGNSLALIRGRIRMLEKVIVAADDDRIIGLARNELAAERAAEQLESALVATIKGDTAKGLPALRAQRHALSGPVWTLSFGLWRLFPFLAPPMLAWRHKRHIHSIAPNRALGGPLR